MLSLNVSFTSNSTGFDCFNFKSALGLSIWVKSVHQGSVLKWILICGVTSNKVTSNSTEFTLNLVRVDNSCKISASHHTSVKLVTRFFDTFLSVSTEDSVKMVEGILSEDNKSTKMTTWSELKKIKSVDAAGINTWKITGVSLNVGVLIAVHNKRTLCNLETRVSHFL